MADLATAEVERAPKAEAPAEAEQLFTPKPDAPPKLPESLAERSRFYDELLLKVYGSAKEQITQKQDVLKQAETKQAATAETVVRPGIQAVREAASIPAPLPPKQLPVPPQPDITPRPFAASQKDALGAVVQTLGLMAQMAMGGRTAPVAALKSLTGAMNGWKEGDSVRAQRDWTAYLEQVDTIRQENRQALLMWEAAMKAHGSNQQAAQMKLSADLAEAGLGQYAITAATHDLQRTLVDYKMDSDLVQTLIAHTDKIEMARITDARHQREEQIRKEEYAAVERRHQENLKEKQRESDRTFGEKVREFNAKRAEDKTASSLTPAATRLAAEQYYATGALPALGMGAASTAKRTEIMNMAGDMATGAGTSGADFVSRTQFAKASQGELNALLKQRGQLMSFAHTATQNLNAALALSEKVDRAGVPVLDRWIQAGRRVLEGDPDVTQFHIFNNRAVSEIARLTSSATGGGVSTDSARREAEALLETAFTQPQYRAAVAALEQEVDFRRTGFEKQIKAVEDNVRRLLPNEGKASVTAPAAPKPGMVRVKRKSDGATGWLDQKDLTDLYELVQ